ncbi:MAG: class I SAM-dependent methyltransferase [Rhodospirillaceae bacterium]|nr:class I SAM-dependent methyltransferase [Rhodospirillaceae bacterium]
MNTSPKLRLSMNAVRRDGRPLERLIFHYETEKRLVGILKSADKKDRARLYTELYDEYSRTCPDRKIMAIAADPELASVLADQELQSIRRYIRPGSTFLEVGPGAGNLTKKAAALAGQCLAVDVSTEVAKKTDFPENVRYLISDGSSIPAEDDCVDFAYSNQLMEHLHPDDALGQLQEIHRVLKPGGAYLCITPNRLTGPHDISKFFDEVATGFHLKEYTLGELNALMRKSGFRRVRRAMLARGHDFGEAPIAPFITYERMIDALSQNAPDFLRRALRRNYLTRGLLQAAVVAKK